MSRMSCFRLSVSATGMALAGCVFSGIAEAAEPVSSVPVVKATVVKPAADSRGGQALRAAVKSALARAGGTPDEATVRRFVDLYNEVQANTDLPASQRQSLGLALRTRLMRLGAALEADGAIARPAPARRPVGPPAILAQQLNPGQLPGQAQAPQRPIDHGQELLELIQDTIKPESWDARGGLGTIKYWPMGHAMVVRQTGEVHEQLGRLLMDLR